MISRILMVAPHFAEYSERLCAGLAKRCPTAILINSLNRADEVSRPIASDAQLIEMPMNRRPDQARALLRALMMARRADLVILQEGVRQYLKPLIWLLRHFTRIALIVHDPVPHSGSDSARAAEHGRYRRWLREHADALIVHGESCRRAIIDLGYAEEKVVMINHGVLMPPEGRLDARPEPGRVLMFGRMEAYKGLDVALDAADLLAARGVSLRLVVAGAGPEQQRLGARMAAMPHVEVIDRFLAPDELAEQIGRASLVIAPYRDATQSGVIATALANGRPVIASAVGGLGDVVHPGMNGRLVPPGDAAALAEAIGALVGDPGEARRLGDGARHHAETALDWGTIAGDLLTQLSARLPVRRLRDRLPARTGMLGTLVGVTLLVSQAACTAQVGGADGFAAPLGDKVFTAPDCGDAAAVDSRPQRDPPVADMYGDSEDLPAGLVNKDGTPMGYAMHPRIAYGNHPPAAWHAMVPWGEIYPGAKGSTATNTRVEIRNLRLFVRPAATGRWCLLQYTDVPIGAYYPADFGNEVSFRGPQRQEPDVGLSFPMITGRVFHFFAKKRVPIPDGGVTGVYTDFEARKILDDPNGPDDRDQASIVANAGADYWQDIVVPGGHTLVTNGDAAISRFRLVGKGWQLYHMNTAAPGAAQRPMQDMKQ